MAFPPLADVAAALRKITEILSNDLAVPTNEPPRWTEFEWGVCVARLELKEGAAQIPGSSAVPWYGISHGARILRWVFPRPSRVQTLLSVRAALAHLD